MSGNTASHHVNGILGLLCRTHFPSMVMHAGNLEPAFTFAHYESAPTWKQAPWLRSSFGSSG